MSLPNETPVAQRISEHQPKHLSQFKGNNTRLKSPATSAATSSSSSASTISQMSSASRQQRPQSGPKFKVVPCPPKTYYGSCKLDKYKIIKQLGKGTFGVVFKGQDIQFKRYVAIKRIIKHSKSDGYPLTALRESCILKELQEAGHCENLIELLDMIRDRPAPNDNYENYDARLNKSNQKDFFMVFPYMSFDLTGILGNPNIKLLESDLKSIMVQLLKGINFIHDKGFLHRDIKASNILLDVHGILKIADFGLARNYNGPVPTHVLPGGGNTPLTEVVMTRWYRAPEVLFGERNYTTAVDIWGIGCVFGELYERKPILPGKSDLQQVYDIFKLVGEPTLENYPELNLDKLKEKKIELTPTEGNLFKRFQSLMSPEGIDLLKKMLTLYPMRRITGISAIEHQFFKTEPLPTDKVTVNFAECHEADISRMREEQKQKQKLAQAQTQSNRMNDPLGRRFVPNQSNVSQPQPPIPSQVPMGSNFNSIPPQGTQVSSNSYIMANLPPKPLPNGPSGGMVTKPRTKFIQNDHNDGNNNRPQRSAHPQDLETPPPVQYSNGGGGYNDYGRQHNQQHYNNGNNGNYRQWGPHGGNGGNGGYGGSWNGRPTRRDYGDSYGQQAQMQAQLQGQSIPNKRPYPSHQNNTNNFEPYNQGDHKRRYPSSYPNKTNNNTNNGNTNGNNNNNGNHRQRYNNNNDNGHEKGSLNY